MVGLSPKDAMKLDASKDPEPIQVSLEESQNKEPNVDMEKEDTKAEQKDKGHEQSQYGLEQNTADDESKSEKAKASSEKESHAARKMEQDTEVAGAEKEKKEAPVLEQMKPEKPAPENDNAKADKKEKDQEEICLQRLNHRAQAVKEPVKLERKHFFPIPMTDETLVGEKQKKDNEEFQRWMEELRGKAKAKKEKEEDKVKPEKEPDVPVPPAMGLLDNAEFFRRWLESVDPANKTSGVEQDAKADKNEAEMHEKSEQVRAEKRQNMHAKYRREQMLKEGAEAGNGPFFNGQNDNVQGVKDRVDPHMGAFVKALGPDAQGFLGPPPVYGPPYLFGPHNHFGPCKGFGKDAEAAKGLFAQALKPRVPAPATDICCRISDRLIRLLYNRNIDSKTDGAPLTELGLLTLIQEEWAKVRGGPSFSFSLSDHDRVLHQWISERCVLLDAEVVHGHPDLSQEATRFLTLNTLRTNRWQFYQVMHQTYGLVWDNESFKSVLCETFMRICKVEGEGMKDLFRKGIEMQNWTKNSMDENMVLKMAK